MAEDKAATVTRQRGPSSIVPEGDLAQIMVDTWGHKAEFHRGDIVKLSDLNPDHYDAKHAVNMGVVRLLSEAEARSLPTTTALDYNLERDEDHARAMLFHAGISPDVAETVTTKQGRAEPKEFAKPTLEGPTGGAEPPHPVRIATTEEIETGTAGPEVVPTSAGPAFAVPGEDEETAGRRGRSRSRE